MHLTGTTSANYTDSHFISHVDITSYCSQYLRRFAGGNLLPIDSRVTLMQFSDVLWGNLVWLPQL
jgi:hypothetical protein